MEWSELGWQAWLTLGMLAFVLGALIHGAAPPDMVLWGAAVLLTVFGVIDPATALSGLSSKGVVAVGALFVISAAMRTTGALDWVGARGLGKGKTEHSAIWRMVPQVAGLSAFLNNTAVVAILMPPINDWCRQRRIAPSKLLLPLSYFSILGGVCTLIGTSTNLVVNGQMRERGMPAIGMFEMSIVGVGIVLVGASYLVFIGSRLLPSRGEQLEDPTKSAKRYLVELRIEPSCPLIGQQVDHAGLRRIPGLFLIEILRDGRAIAPVEPDEVLRAGDCLSFSGALSMIVDLQRTPGLTLVADDGSQKLDAHAARQRHYCEAVISRTSPLIAKTVRESNFRARYNAGVLAVHRGGERLTGRIGDIKLRAGDTMLLQTGPHFAVAHRSNPDFYLVSAIDDARPVAHDRRWVAFALLLGLVGLLVAGDSIPTLQLENEIAILAIAGLAIITRCVSASDARRAVPLDILLTIAAAFAIGQALDQSGAAKALAHSVITVSGGIGANPWFALALVYAVTLLCTELLTNNAAAVLMFPLAMSVAEQIGADTRPFAFAVCYAASLGFATPFGYQTHLMVYGPGGYRFMDFVKVGLPLDILAGAVAVLMIPLVWPFHP